MNNNGIKVSIIGAGSTYGIFLVKWALQLKKFPENDAGLKVGSLSFSNTTERSKNLVLEVLLNDLSHMPQFSAITSEQLLQEVRGYTDWRSMIRQESPDLVIVCSPTNTHVDYLRELLTDFKVKNILCEPPLSALADLEQLRGIADLAKEKSAQVGVNQQYAAFYDCLKTLPLNPADANSILFGDLLSGLDALEITFITHGNHIWRKMNAVGEQELLEDLGPHVFHLIPPDLRAQKLTVQDVKKEGDNLFLNFLEYHLTLGKTPVRMTLGYHRKLKSMKLVFRKNGQEYEFYVSGSINPETGEFTRWIEGKNGAATFKHFLKSDLVKTSFIASISGSPIVAIEQGIETLKFIQSLCQR